jgi:hypothetical protein
MDFSEFDYRFAKLILKECYPEIAADVVDVITSLNIPLGRGHRPTPSKVLQGLFFDKGWNTERQVGETDLHFDCAKDKVAMEIETTDPADVINDLLKFQVADLWNDIDAGVLIVYDDSVRGNNIPHLRDVKKLLATFSTIIYVPVWALGLKQ